MRTQASPTKSCQQTQIHCLHVLACLSINLSVSGPTWTVLPLCLRSEGLASKAVLRRRVANPRLSLSRFCALCRCLFPLVAALLFLSLDGLCLCECVRVCVCVCVSLLCVRPHLLVPWLAYLHACLLSCWLACLFDCLLVSLFACLFACLPA